MERGRQPRPLFSTSSDWRTPKEVKTTAKKSKWMKAAPLAIGLMLAIMAVLSVASMASAYTYHDSSWNDSANTLEDAGNFALAQLPLLIKLCIYGCLIGLGFIGYKKVSATIGK